MPKGIEDVLAAYDDICQVFGQPHRLPVGRDRLCCRRSGDWDLIDRGQVLAGRRTRLARFKV